MNNHEAIVIKNEVATSQNDITITIEPDFEDTGVLTLLLSTLSDKSSPFTYKALCHGPSMEIYLTLTQCIELKEILSKRINKEKRDKKKAKIEPRMT